MPLKQLRLLRILKDQPIEVGSVVKFRLNNQRHVGEVYSILSGNNPKAEVIMYDKRLRPMFTAGSKYKIRKVSLDKCKLVDENFKFNTSKDFVLGDVVVKKTTLGYRYGVIIGFHHPDGLFSTSYENGYNGTDMIDCVEIEKRGLRRKRRRDGTLKRFTTLCEKLSTCEIDLWNRSGPKIIHK